MENAVLHLPKILIASCLIIFFGISLTLICRNPFCPLVSSKKRAQKNNPSLRLLAVTSAKEDSSKIALIKNKNVIGHYKIGDQIQSHHVAEIHYDYVVCKELHGKKTIIYP
jgi:hypothetical protein